MRTDVAHALSVPRRHSWRRMCGSYLKTQASRGVSTRQTKSSRHKCIMAARLGKWGGRPRLRRTPRSGSRTFFQRLRLPEQADEGVGRSPGGLPHLPESCCADSDLPEPPERTLLSNSPAPLPDGL